MPPFSEAYKHLKIPDRSEREQEVAKMLGLDPRHPMVIEAVEIERGERNPDGTWK